MALSLKNLFVGTIVDWVSEWGEDGKERPKDKRRRGIIVKMEGSAVEQSVGKVWVYFTEREGDKVDVQGKKIRAIEVKASELVEVYDYESKESRVAWRRIFGMPVNVGAEFAQKKNQSRRTIISDELGLTPRPKDGVVTDENDLGVEDMELPEANA
jgi:hypothetical protein